MRPLWVLVVVLGLVITACGKQKQSEQSTAAVSKPKTEETKGMEGMAGMGEMEAMETAAGDSAGPTGAGVKLDRTAADRFGISFARAAIRPLGRETRVVGTLGYAEPRRQYVNARVMGWVERLYADYMGKPVRKGDALLALYSPELVSAQEEYLSARRLGDKSLATAALRRLSLWNIPEDQIDSLERTGQARRTIVLRSPMSGEIAEKMVTEGQAVQPGDNLFLIADRRVLWVDLAVFETDARAVRVGSPVEVTVDAIPGKTYPGRVTFIHPTLDEKTRTITARAEVMNPDGALRPGMYATAMIRPATAKALTIPTQAVLPTGTQNLVFVNRGDGEFVPRAVALGTQGDSLVEIVHGLKAGDEVIASAVYLLDSESNLAAAMKGLMLQMGMGLDMGGMTAGQGDSGTAGQDMKGMKMGEEEKR
ncbi:MAG: rane fusion protein copper/silver efflux system [Gemmatimonadales bacterium]|jgi:Cu(I)/Ag(I) efflux system membrane fusion protein|nr:rane fusion protein copper/silver efflux system [Gemmatimonadales bacterium]